MQRPDGAGGGQEVLRISISVSFVGSIGSISISFSSSTSV